MSTLAATKMAYRIEEVCEALSISRSTLYAMIDRGEIERVKLGGAARIPAHEIRRLLRLPVNEPA